MDIQGMNRQIKDMEMELEHYNKSNLDLDLAISDLKLKLKAAQKQVDKEKEKVENGLGLLRRFKLDLSDAIQNLDDPKRLKVIISV